MRMMKLLKNNGLTLIELLVTLAVLSVLFVVAVPGYQRLTESNREIGGINSLAGDLKLAQSEAARTGRVVTVCASDNGTSCNTLNWQDGWITFIDPDRDTVLSAGTDTLLSEKSGLPTGFTLRDTNFITPGVVQYLPTGALVGTELGLDPDGTVILCERTNTLTRARAINISNIGRVKVARDIDADDIVNDIDGVNVACP